MRAEVEIGAVSTSIMALSIKNPEADRLARRLADATGENITTAVLIALRQRLERETGWSEWGARAEIARIQARAATAPILDDRTPDEIIGYDELGLPS